MCGVCPGPFGEELSPPFVSNMSKAQRHAGVGGLLREAIRSQIGFVAARKAGGGFRREVQPRRQHWFLNEKSGFPFRTPAFCSVSRGRRRLGEKEYRAPSVTPGVALRPRTQGLLSFTISQPANTRCLLTSRCRSGAADSKAIAVDDPAEPEDAGEEATLSRTQDHAKAERQICSEARLASSRDWERKLTIYYIFSKSLINTASTNKTYL